MPSAWDACTREAVNLDSLQLDVAHKVPPEFIPTRKLGPKNPRWYNDKAAPLTDPDKLPKGWTADEPDLDPRDIDGQIDRCRERIAANIVPSIFWQRLAEYQEAKEAEIALESRYPNFSKDVRIRLDHLYSIAKDIEIHGSGDSESPSRNVKNTQLPNIRAVIDAYYARKLEWTPGLVTYWSRGKQLCEPRQYNWDEFEAIYKKHNGHESFWVEGAATPGPMSVLRSIQLDNGPYLSNTYKIAIRVPGIKWWAELEFMLDTGSPMMTLYEGDIKTIMGPFAAPLPPTTRSLMISTSTNDIVRREVIELEVTILDKKKERVVPWWRIEATMEPGNWNPAPDQCRTRLDGAWVRYLMYMTSAPDGNLSTYLSTDMHSLLMDVPEVDPKTRKGPLQADLYTTSPKPSPLTNVRGREGRSRTSSDPTTETAWQPRVAPDVYIPLITPWRD
ncbi:hypothetical protein N7456_006593 [Penicillium angulare]|uniref:Uncharacterized protein n=1 Tax=Penicillium angulare TaxID=116970 RepID=A0A9W9FHZ0_9EURO|nr:hypothetical protein N7456_006593 [Penicillium angulare]